MKPHKGRQKIKISPARAQGPRAGDDGCVQQRPNGKARKLACRSAFNVVGLIIYALYYYYFKYTMGKVATASSKLTDFVSELYFYERGKFYQVFFKAPKNRKVLVAHTGYVLTRVVIFGSFLATIHNLCQFYDVGAYDTFREMVRRPLFVIYGLIVVSIGYFYYMLWRKEFALAKNNFEK